MTISQIIGICLLASPFVAAFVWIVREDGWRAAFSTFGVTLAIMAVITVGSILLVGWS